MRIRKIRVPTPEIIIAKDNSCYAWECNHKGLGYRTLGDTAQEAKEEFINSIDAINADIKAGWCGWKDCQVAL